MSESKRLVIENKATGPQWEKKFFLDIEQAILGGYRVAKNPHSADCTMRNYLGFMGRAVLYKEGYEPLQGEPKGVARESSSLLETPKVDTETTPEETPKVDTETTPEETPKVDTETTPEELTSKLQSLTKKDELLAFASDNGVEVPKEFNKPSQIKKFLKENIN